MFFIPVLVQLALKSDQLLEFLADSGDRVTHVPWYYYLDKLDLVRGLRHAADLAGRDRDRAAAAGRPGTGCCIFWVFVAALFFQVYPLKAFNYLLPLIPALSILAGRAVHDVALAFVALVEARARRSARRLGLSVGRTGARSLPAAPDRRRHRVAGRSTCVEAGLLLRPARGGQLAEDEHVARTTA